MLGDAKVVEATGAFVRLVLRRPHAYKFSADHGDTPIPGLVVLDAEGKVAASLALPAEDTAKISSFLAGTSK